MARLSRTDRKAIAATGLLQLHRVALEQAFTGNRAIVLVSHAEQQVERLCDRAICLEQGKIAAEGPVETVLAAYADLPVN